jgi:hypothetical protein
MPVSGRVCVSHWRLSLTERSAAGRGRYQCSGRGAGRGAQSPKTWSSRTDGSQTLVLQIRSGTQPGRTNSRARALSDSQPLGHPYPFPQCHREASTSPDRRERRHIGFFLPNGVVGVRELGGDLGGLRSAVTRRDTGWKAYGSTHPSGAAKGHVGTAGPGLALLASRLSRKPARRSAE